MIIRLLEPNDAKEYYDLRLEALQVNPEAFSTSFEEVITSPNIVEHYEKSFRQTNTYNFGAFQENKMIGMVTLFPETKEKLKHKASIFAMYVKPAYRGQGIGKLLLEAALKQAYELGGLSKINLSVVSNNHEAKGLYQRYGFKTFGLEEKALMVNHAFYDEEYMSLWLSNKE
ncbi:N-acetyltransferase family protein [Ornithinibacillus bavariensis]|uniref:GNAT family N-acetyltransferase n=1 Tax=Ornithinibacillus bavariensis TaxID=545502 RepID=UPI003D252956